MQKKLTSPMRSTIARARTAPLPPVNDPHTEICLQNAANLPGEKHKAIKSPLSRAFDIKGKRE